MSFVVYLLSDNSSFFRLGNLGKPFRVVRPTLIRLSDSRDVYSSVRPTILVLRQLSRFNSVICGHLSHKYSSKYANFLILFCFSWLIHQQIYLPDWPYEHVSPTLFFFPWFNLIWFFLAATTVIVVVVVGEDIVYDFCDIN